MKILYLSALASQNVNSEAYKRDPNYCGFAVQKFSRLVAEGLAKNGAKVTALSSFFIPNAGLLWHHHSDIEKGVRFKYVPSINFGPIRHIWLIVYCFVYVFVWGLFNKKNKALMCDVLNISSCIGAVAAARINRIRCVGVVTDLPGMVPGRSIKECVESKQMKICMTYIRHCTHYLLLTEQMNTIVNQHNRPYMIMEGLVDSDMNEVVFPKKNESKCVALYAGGLKEGYGLRLLVEGFIKANVDDSELWIFGFGPFVEDLKLYEQKNNRIKYLGIRPNNEIVEAEMQASLLINPRPTFEEITQYSFPSKNMEFMVSGTPVLTTVLPGMPKEYHNYVYLFNQGETIEGYASVIRNTLTLPAEILKQKGNEARRWVLDNKNNIKQAERILDFVNS